MEEDKELDKIKNRMLKRLMRLEDHGPWIDGSVVELNDSTFDDAIAKTQRPILVDFWADWCAPCRMMKPVVETLASEYSCRAHFAKVDVDRNQTLTRRYGIMSVPNFVIFKNGNSVERVVGAVGRTGLEIALQKHLR